MDASPFARLSAELRNHIWTYALQATSPIRFRVKESLIPPHAQIPLKDISALTETCRAIRSETRLLFFNTNTFAFHGILHYLDKDFNSFISSIGADRQEALGSLVFEVYDLHVGGNDPGTVSQAFRPEVMHALHRFRLFALEHGGCDCRLRYRPVPVFGKVSIDLRNISTSATAVMAELRELALETPRHRKEIEFVARVFKQWRDVLGQVSDPPVLRRCLVFEGAI